MATKAVKVGDRVPLVSGPWKGVRTTPNPFDDQGPDELAGAVNCYPADAQRAGGFFQRPGATRPASLGGSPVATRGGYMHVAADGTVYNFVFLVNGSGVLKVYRWDAMGASLTDVTPTTIILSATGQFYATSLNGEMIVNDGVNKLWRASSLGSTPIVATPIEQQTPTTDLSLGSNDLRLANAAFSYIYRAGGSLGSQATFAANATGTSVGALGQIAANTWGIILVELNTSSGALVFTAAFNAGSGYATEALAIAARPARTVTNWYVGYVTVRADAGAVWIANTDAFAGGTTGNQAQTTNYYAGEGPAYAVFGQPVIYYGALFVIYQQVDVANVPTYARTTIGWSEPNQPAVGYQQTDYDNQWTLVQTGTAPLYTLIATNDALYYARELSWGALGGAPGVNFQGTATHDIVAGNIGCPHPRSAIFFLGWIYFTDQTGKPYRFALGGYPEPLWLQAQSIFDATTVTTDTSLAPWAVIEPNLNLYLLNYRDQADANTLLVFDALTGRYAGTWVIGGAVMVFGTQYRDGATAATGNVSVGFFQLPTTSIFAWKLGLVSDNVWADNGTAMSGVAITTGKMNYSDKTTTTVDQVRAIVGYNTSAGPTVALAVTSSQRASVAFGDGGVIAAPPELPLHRLWWSAPTAVQGRDVGMALTVSTPTAQTRFYRVVAEGIVSESSVADW